MSDYKLYMIKVTFFDGVSIFRCVSHVNFIYAADSLRNTTFDVDGKTIYPPQSILKMEMVQNETK